MRVTLEASIMLHSPLLCSLLLSCIVQLSLYCLALFHLDAMITLRLHCCCPVHCFQGCFSYFCARLLPAFSTALPPCAQVYFQTSCQKNELVCSLNEADFPVEVHLPRPRCALCFATLILVYHVLSQDIEKRADLISRMIQGLQLDAESNKPMLGADIPVLWVAR